MNRKWIHNLLKIISLNSLIYFSFSDEEESNEDEEIEVSNSNIGDTVIEHDENSAVITAEVASNSKLENPQKLEMFDIDLGTNRTCNYSDSSQCTDEESLITDQRIEECRCEILQMLNDSDCSVERLNEKITELSLLRSYRHSDGIESPVTSTTGNSCLVIDSGILNEMFVWLTVFI